MQGPQSSIQTLCFWIIFYYCLGVMTADPELSLARYRDTAVYANNSIIDINLVGEGFEGEQITAGGALECHTDDTTCCLGDFNETGKGEWYYPNGTVVPPSGGDGGFYRSRGLMVIRLNRLDGNESAQAITGVYRCEIPGAGGVTIIRFVTLTRGVRCLNLTEISNGSISYTPPLTVLPDLPIGQQYIGTTATFSCSPGYQMVGGSLLQACLDGRIWNGTTPCCASKQECHIQGNLVIHQCSVPAEPGLLEWVGSGFDCVSHQTVINNKLVLTTVDPIVCRSSMPVETGLCGPYEGNLTCTEDGTELISLLWFYANQTLNGGYIKCMHRGKVFETFLIQTGVIPDPPEHANLTFPSISVCQYDWVPPVDNVTGGIRGYNLSYYGDCGKCSPLGLVNSTTLRAMCSGWTVNGQTCDFEIQTVTADCGFYSEPAHLTSILDNRPPTDIRVEILCSESTDFPIIHVNWKYDPPNVENTTIIPGVLGFRIIISDEFNNSLVETLLDSEIRSDNINSKILAEAHLIADSMHMATVEVETEVGNFSNTSIATFSVTATMTDPSPILTERQCIEVSINSFCNENEGSFQAQLLYTEGMCGKNATIATSTNNSDPLDKNYTFCVPINETGTICYSALVYHNSVVVGRTEPQQLILLPCNTSSLNLNHAKVVINSTMGIVYQGDEVSHNTILFFRCVMGCDLSGPGQAHCVNGTFESGSNITSSVQCTCRGDDTTSNVPAIAGGIAGPGGFLLLSVCIIVLLVVLYKRRTSKTKPSESSPTPTYKDLLRKEQDKPTKPENEADSNQTKEPSAT